MYRTLILAASIAALSVPAFADDVTISLAGKTKAQVVAEIRNAAESVCEKQNFTHLTDRSVCVAETEHDALSQLAAAEKFAGKAS